MSYIYHNKSQQQASSCVKKGYWNICFRQLGVFVHESGKSGEPSAETYCEE